MFNLFYWCKKNEEGFHSLCSSSSIYCVCFVSPEDEVSEGKIEKKRPLNLNKLDVTKEKESDLGKQERKKSQS